MISQLETQIRESVKTGEWQIIKMSDYSPTEQEEIMQILKKIKKEIGREKSWQ